MATKWFVRPQIAGMDRTRALHPHAMLNPDRLRSHPPACTKSSQTTGTKNLSKSI